MIEFQAARPSSAGATTSPAARPPERDLRTLSLAVEQSATMLATDPSGIIQYANPTCAAKPAMPPLSSPAPCPTCWTPAASSSTSTPNSGAPSRPAACGGRSASCGARTATPCGSGISVSGLTETADAAARSPTACGCSKTCGPSPGAPPCAKPKRLAEEAAESKTRFLANMSHEIRAPLNAIIGLANLCQGTGLDPPSATTSTRSRPPAPPCWAW